MNQLVLVRPSEAYTDAICSYRQEFLESDGRSHGDSGLRKYEDVHAWIEQCRLMEHQETVSDPGFSRSDQFMLVEEGKRRILGMIHLRHSLNDDLAMHGGHIGYAIRPFERRKGYAKAMLSLCLEYCRAAGLDKVLILCDSDNEASRKTILACGGKLENEVYMENQDTYEERYWIDLNPLASFYSYRDEDGRLIPKQGQVEFLTTLHYIEQYLTPGAKVIEIGAGTGRYSRTIADRGYAVEAVELLEHHLKILKENCKPEQQIHATQGNALDLSSFSDHSFDITLLLGPLYHLYSESDKNQAISEALRVTKPGGIVFAAYCISDASVVWSGFQLQKFIVADDIKLGKIDPVTFRTVSAPEDIFELVRKEDIDRLMSKFPVERLHYVATDLFTLYMRDTINAMDDETFALYLRYHFSVCERADMVGITHHSLDVFRKEV